MSCWFQNYNLVQNTWSRGQNMTPYCTLDISRSPNATPQIVILTIDSYPGLFFAKHTWHHICLPLWGQWSLFCTLSQLVEGVILPCGVVWCQSALPPPVNLWVRSAQGRGHVLSVHILSISVSSFSLSLPWGYVFVIKYPASFRRHS
jgi:hypothetical protein